MKKPGPPEEGPALMIRQQADERPTRSAGVAARLGGTGGLSTAGRLRTAAGAAARAALAGTAAKETATTRLRAAGGLSTAGRFGTTGGLSRTAGRLGSTASGLSRTARLSGTGRGTVTAAAVPTTGSRGRIGCKDTDHQQNGTHRHERRKTLHRHTPLREDQTESQSVERLIQLFEAREPIAGLQRPTPYPLTRKYGKWKICADGQIAGRVK